MSEFPKIIAALQAKNHFPYPETQDPDGSKNERSRTNSVTRFEATVVQAREAIAAGSIPNPRVADIKDRFNRTMETASDAMRWDAFPRGYDYTTMPDVDHDFLDLMSAASCNYVPGKLARMKKSKSTLSHKAEAIALFEEGKLLNDLLEQVKAIAVKRQPKPVEDIRKRYEAPAARNAATMMVLNMMREVTDQHYQGLIKLFSNADHAIVAQFEQLQAELIAERGPMSRERALRAIHGDRRAPRYNPEIEQIISYIDYQMSTKKLTLDEVITSTSTARADDIRKHFLADNVAKLDSILEKKGDFDSCSIVGSQLSLSGMEGTFLFTFKDGASFEVNNSVVMSHSIHGKRFIRTPITFHNVRLAGNRKMSKPSEQRMNEVFVVGAVEA